MNLFEQYDEIMTPEVVANISSAADDTSGNEEISLKSVFYTIVAGLIKRANTNIGVSLFHKQVIKGGEGGEVADNFAAYTADKQRVATITAKGDKLLSQVFPAVKSPLIGTVGLYADTPKPAAIIYSGLMANLVVDLLDKEIKANNFNSGELNDYILEHHQQLLQDSPEGLLDIAIPALGLQELRSMRFNTAKKRAYTSSDIDVPSSIEPEPDYDEMARRKGISPTAIFGIVMIILAVAGFAWWYLTQRPAVEEPIVETVDDAPVYLADSAAADSTAAISESVATGSSLTELSTYVTGTGNAAGQTIALNDLQFVNGTSTLDPSASVIADGIYKLLQENPRLQIRVVGYDAEGNKSIAGQRAYALKRELLNRGGDNNRIDAAGSVTPGKTGVGITVISK